MTEETCTSKKKGTAVWTEQGLLSDLCQCAGIAPMDVIDCAGPGRQHLTSQIDRSYLFSATPGYLPWGYLISP